MLEKVCAVSQQTEGYDCTASAGILELSEAWEFLGTPVKMQTAGPSYNSKVLSSKLGMVPRDLHLNKHLADFGLGGWVGGC